MHIILDTDDIPQQYDGFAQFLNRGGYVVFAAPPQHNADVSRATQIEIHNAQNLQRKYNLPIYVFGNGVGAVIAQNLLNRTDLVHAGICLSGPRHQSRVQTYIKIMLMWGCKLLLGKHRRVRCLGGLNPFQHRTIPSCGETYQTLQHMARCRYGQCLMRPMLVIGGGGDVASCNTNLTKSLYNAYRTADMHNLTMVIYPDVYRVSPRILGWERIQDDVLEFLGQNSLTTL